MYNRLNLSATFDETAFVVGDSAVRYHCIQKLESLVSFEPEPEKIPPIKPFEGRRSALGG